MKNQSYNHTILKLGKLLIGTQSRHSYNGKKMFFVDFGSLSILEFKF